MIIDSLRNYMIKCPYLDNFNNAVKVNVNYLESNTDTYSIEEIPIKTIIKKYVNGDSVRQYAFIFTSREPYESDVLQNIDNSGFYEKFVEWIESNNNNEILPVLENNLEPLELKVTSTVYAFAVTEDTAQFQIQLKLKYFEKG